MKRFKIMHLAKLACGLLALAALGGAVMLLWNAVMPAILPGQVQALGYWHALGLLALCRILFGGFRGRGRWHGHHHAQHRQRWEKWQAMTAEEREQFRKNRWGAWGRSEQ